MTPLEKMLVEHEGMRLDLYRDTASPPRWTIGVGRNLSDVGLRDETEALFLLGRDLDAIRAELDHAWPHWRQLDEVRAGVVLSMAFNLGVAGFMRFVKTRRLIDGGLGIALAWRCSNRVGPTWWGHGPQNFRQYCRRGEGEYRLQSWYL